MSTFILTWDGSDEGYSPTELAADVVATRAGRTTPATWSMGSRRRDIAAGDALFLLRQGADRGIIAAGTATDGIVYADQHWADTTKTAAYTRVTWTRVVPTDDRLDVEDLLRLVPEHHWNNIMGSGQQVQAPADSELQTAWKSHLRNVDSASDEGAGTEADQAGQPPTLGDEFDSRTSIYERFGGDKMAGIVRFPGDPTVNLFADASGPYTDDPPTLTEPFGYRGAGRTGPQQLTYRGNKLLEQARTDRSPVRYWYKPVGEPFTFLAWCAVLGRSWIDGVGSDGHPRPELDWLLEAVPAPDSGDWPTSVDHAIDDGDSTAEDDPEAPEALPTPTYAELIARVEALGQRRRPNNVVRINPPRSAAARRAVLIRAQGSCESQRCTGMPAESNRHGEPILDVDHVKDLALGGEDHPRNMVALCPNCHACKTRGDNASRWRRELHAVAHAANAAHLR